MVSTGNSLPSFRNAEQFQPNTHWAYSRVGSKAFTMTWMLATITLRDETFDGLTNQLRPRVSEQSLGLGIYERDHPILVYDHHRVRAKLPTTLEIYPLPSA